MGVLNVTPDSFSDGGVYFGSLDSAIRKAELMTLEGADIIDIGGESTRPGAETLPVAEELDRVIPVIEAIARRISVRISVDTRKSAVAREAVRAGATVINDVSGGLDRGMKDVLLLNPRTEIILMHMQGDPSTMQLGPEYPRGVVTEVKEFLLKQVASLTDSGISPERVWVDPGIGFGKTVTHNLELMRELAQFSELAGPLVIGTSRKSFLAHVVGDAQSSFAIRLAGTLASNLWAYDRGASVFRVHDVGELARALKTWMCIERGSL